MEFLVVCCLGLIAFLLLEKKFEREQKLRDVRFEQIMTALEEKAKKEGTFKVSYFDGDRK